MILSWILYQSTGTLSLLIATVVCAVACAIFCLYFKNGRTLRGIKRLAVGLLVADLLTELAYYLNYSGYLPGRDPMTEPLSLWPSVLLTALYFVCSGVMVKLVNDIKG